MQMVMQMMMQIMMQKVDEPNEDVNGKTKRVEGSGVN
jgi:hypothetical protein